MAFTDDCSIFGSVHEGGVNLVALHVMRQRPSLFNYGTQFFVSNPERLCREVDPHPEVLRRGNPLVTRVDPLPIPGTSGLFGLDFCFQLTKVAVDFHPTNQFGLPPELGKELKEQHAAVVIEACAGIYCPNRDKADDFGNQIAEVVFSQRRGKDDDRPPDEERPPLQPIPGERVVCFCLEVFGVIHTEYVGPVGDRKLAIRLDGLEIVDVRPEGLESALECYLATVLRVGILPRFRPSIEAIMFDLGKYLKLGSSIPLVIGPTPLSDVPHNPAVEKDQLKVFVNVGVAP